MSKIDVTTQELLRRLGPTSRSRSAKADAVFRRLRLEQSDQIADALARAPKSIKPAGMVRGSDRKIVIQEPE